jgi:DNA gyrase subunit A
MLPKAPYNKCAKVVGDTMGKYHPHGDMAIYEALVRLAQAWSMRLPLIDPHGGFGSLDDPASASRYTACRMAASALSLVEGIDEDTVNMTETYDGTGVEPEVMPAGFPNLLVNGSTGIAVGMATNMPPHNLVEVIKGLQALLLNPTMSLSELMKFILGPDLPTGGIIIGREGIKEAYVTGRGSFMLRASATIEDTTGRKKAIVITELPYNVGPVKIMERVKALVNAKKLTGVSNINDFTDRKTPGLHLVIECKNGFNPQAVLDELYRLTPLQETFSVNNVALVDGEPKTLGLLELCSLYLKHRLEVVRRRTVFRLAKTKAREHIVEGLVLALVSIDKVIKIIKSSSSTAVAREKLSKAFALSDIQTDVILEMPLRRLTSLEVASLKGELKDLKVTIAELNKLLSSDKVMRELVSTELGEVSKLHGTPRKSRLVKDLAIVSSASVSLEIPDDPCIVVLTTTGLIGRYGIEPFSGKASKHDVVLSQAITTNRAIIGVVTSHGRLMRCSVIDLPIAAGSSRGVLCKEVFSFEPGESAVGLFDASNGQAIVMGTAQGFIKKILTSEFPLRLDPKPIITLKPKDKVVGVVALSSKCAESFDGIFVTTDAQLLRFNLNLVASKGMTAGGMAGIRVADGNEVILFTCYEPGSLAVVVTISDMGSVKVSSVADYPTKGRGTGGVRCMTLRKAEAGIVAAGVGIKLPIGISAAGSVVGYPKDRSKRDGSGSPLEVSIAAFGELRGL